MKRYQKYKDSGIDWIGQIPEHWDVIRSRFVFKIISGNGFPEDLQGRCSGDYPFYKCSDINFAGILVDRANNYVDEADVRNNNWSTVPTRSIVFAKIGEALKKNHRKINKSNCLVDNNMMAVFLRDSTASIMYYYFLMCLVNMEWFVNPGAVPSIDVSKFRSIFIPEVNSEDQKQIECYLDRKTTQVDDLIVKKERMIGLLKEERIAIIDRAVTKGLDPDVEMKDSGIEWHGEIPAHWKIKRIKFVIEINPQRPNRIAENEQVIFIAMESMNNDGTFDNSVVRLYSEVKTGFTYFAKNDVIFAKITPCFENEKGALLSNLGSKIGFGSTEFHVLRAVHNKTIPEYLYFLTISGMFRRLGEAFMKGVAGQKRVTNDFVQNFTIGIPPVDEQETISKYLDKKCGQIDNQIKYEQKSIELLKEYRTALISEVVTGKIDVREAEDRTTQKTADRREEKRVMPQGLRGPPILFSFAFFWSLASGISP